MRSRFVFAILSLETRLGLASTSMAMATEAITAQTMNERPRKTMLKIFQLNEWTFFWPGCWLASSSSLWIAAAFSLMGRSSKSVMVELLSFVFVRRLEMSLLMLDGTRGIVALVHVDLGGRDGGGSGRGCE